MTVEDMHMQLQSRYRASRANKGGTWEGKHPLVEALDELSDLMIYLQLGHSSVSDADFMVLNTIWCHAFASYDALASLVTRRKIGQGPMPWPKDECPHVLPGMFRVVRQK